MFPKLLICWDFHIQPSPGFCRTVPKKKENILWVLPSHWLQKWSNLREGRLVGDHWKAAVTQIFGHQGLQNNPSGHNVHVTHHVWRMTEHFFHPWTDTSDDLYVCLAAIRSSFPMLIRHRDIRPSRGSLITFESTPRVSSHRADNVFDLGSHRPLAGPPSAVSTRPFFDWTGRALFWEDPLHWGQLYLSECVRLNPSLHLVSP